MAMRFLVIVGICLALSFAACGGGDSTTTAPTATTEDAGGAGESTTTTAKQVTHRHQGKQRMSKAEIAKLPPLTIAKQSGPPPKHIKVIDLRKGTGATVTKQDAVYVRYFNVSYPEAQEKSQTGLYGPHRYGLDETVKGWTVGLPGM